MRKVIKSSWFAQLDLLLVMASGIAWLFWPDYAAVSPLLLLLLPWILRLIFGEFPRHWEKFDWLVIIFLITAWVGCWASYDSVSALNKAWLITTSAFLYYALSTQPEENIIWITSGLFVIGVGLAVYFILIHDFIEAPRKIEVLNHLGILWTNIRPQLPWPSIHPNYVSGAAVLTGIFGLYPLRKSSQGSLVQIGILTGFFVILLALVMATSRGIWMAIGSMAGIWLLWRLVNLNRIGTRHGKDALFPSIVLIYLCVVIVVLYAGPANAPSSIIGSSDFGTGSRAELFTRSLYFLEAYPIIGGGLAAFPGLYSRYILDIPYFYLINSHNLFLDVFIEQGILGGGAFLLLYLACVWRVSRAIVQTHLPEARLFQWLVLFALVIAIVHGMVDDYLYNAKGAILSLILIGLSLLAIRGNHLITDDNPSDRLGKFVARQWYLFVLSAVFLVIVGINSNHLRAIWYANLGSVQLSKVELDGFPETGWAGPAIVVHLDQADASLHTALELDPLNWTANHRLGLISMLRQDFSSAVAYLNVAHNMTPRHRGIIKLLGFSYAWLGNVDNAVSLLKEIPETKNELDAYYSWWKAQGRTDLSEAAFNLRQILDTLPVQP